MTTLPLTAAYLLMNFSMFLWYSLFGKYLVMDLGFRGDELGASMMLYNLFYALSTLPSGKVSDVVDVRKILATGVVIYSAGTLLMAFSKEFRLMALACAVAGLGEGIFFTSGTVYSVRRGGVRRAGVTYGIVFSTGLLGEVLGALASGYVKEYLGARVMFTASAILSLMSIPLVLILQSFRERTCAGNSSVSLVKLLKEHRSFKLLAVGLIFHSLGYNMIAPFISVHAGELGLADSEIGFVNFTWLLSMMLTAFIWSVLADKLRSKIILAAHIILSSFSWMTYAYSKSFILIIHSAVVLGLVGAMDMPARRKLIAELEGGEGIGTLIGSLDLLTVLFSIPASILGGAIYQRSNILVLFWAASTVNLIGVPILVKVKTRTRGS